MNINILHNNTGHTCMILHALTPQLYSVYTIGIRSDDTVSAAQSNQREHKLRLWFLDVKTSILKRKGRATVAHRQLVILWALLLLNYMDLLHEMYVYSVST